MYSGFSIGEARKKSLRSQEKNLAPLEASDITLLNNSLDSSNEAAGDPASASYSSLSPPATNRTLHGSDLRGRWVHTKLA